MQPAPAKLSLDEYMERYAHDHYEWVKGEIIQMSPITDTHDFITGYLYKLLDIYLALRPIATIRREPFVMRLDSIDASREPDLQVILKTNPGQLTHTAMIGPADVVLEVVSKESVSRDYGDKFEEYEKAGVREYWLIDPLRQNAFFYRLTGDHYTLIAPDSNGAYHPELLPGLRIDVPTLWQDDLPDILKTVDSVKAMLGKA